MRDALLQRTREELTRIAGRKKPADAELIGSQVGKLLARTKMGKHLNWRVVEGRARMEHPRESVAAAKPLDGCYVIKTTISAEAMDKVGEAVFQQITEPTPEIQSILDLLAIAPTHTP